MPGWGDRRAALELVLLIAGFAFWALPVPHLDAPVSDVVLDRDGHILAATVAGDEQWRFSPSGEADPVPERYASALIAFEDGRFYQHPGVDPLAVARALVDNVRQGRVVSGASTLTMQTVRLARGNPPRTVIEKAVEMVFALRLEWATTKREILAMHAAHAPFGGNTVGLEAAAQRYFRRRGSDLSWAEAATLAVLPHSPGLVHPGRDRAALRAKRDRLLDKLVDLGMVSAEDAALGKLERLPARPEPVPQLAPHVLQRHRGQGAVRTTLDAALQRQAAQIVERHAATWSGNQVHNLAALVVDTMSGDVLAYVGNVPGLTGDHGQHVDIVQAPRSTGSLLKPLLYAEMLHAGELLPTELVPDIPMRMGGFAPENFDRQFEGAIPAHQALARSRNVPAVWMLQQHGVDRFYRELQAYGMTTLIRPPSGYGLSLVLGGAEGTLWEMVGAYRRLGWTVATAAQPTPWTPLGLTPAASGVSTPHHDTAEAPAAYWTLQALLDVERPGVLGAWRRFGSSRRVAWKTGTSFGFRDAWAIGVTPQVTVGVWVGNADGEGRPELIGLRAAAPVLFDLLDAAPRGPWFAAPEGQAQIEICTQSGLRAGPDCAHTQWVEVPPAGRKAARCPHCQRIHCRDATCTERVHADCASTATMHHTPWFALPAAQAFYYTRRHTDVRPLPPWAPGCAPEEDVHPIGILDPKPGAQIHVPVELDGRPGRLVMQGAHLDANATLYWHLDERYLGRTEDVHEMEVWPGPGDHVVTVVDQTGARLERRFTVLRPHAATR